MQFIKNNLPLIIVLALAAAAFWAYSEYAPSGQAPLLSTADQSPASQDLLQTLASLQSIQLNPAVFNDPVFQSLTDFGVAIPPQTPGRQDPFAPAGESESDTAAATSSTSQ